MSIALAFGYKYNRIGIYFIAAVFYPFKPRRKMMASNQRLETDQDFKEAMEREAPIRVFQDDHVVDSGGIITRFDDQTIVIQSGVSELAYHARALCEFFEMKRR
jgi:hypothetical protein